MLQVWAKVHHSRPPPSHLLDSASRALTLTAKEEGARARVTRILLDTEASKGPGTD